ncbi:hypothetical protein Btru_075233 [Bulinus truncatus]|nr:hypothetical protein Btru_075233 [Bulinus truncatus]
MKSQLHQETKRPEKIARRINYHNFISLEPGASRGRKGQEHLMIITNILDRLASSSICTVTSERQHVTDRSTNQVDFGPKIGVIYEAKCGPPRGLSYRGVDIWIRPNSLCSGHLDEAKLMV